MASIEIKESDLLLSVEVLDYENVAAQTLEDANWLSCYVTVKSRFFSGAYEASLTTYDLVAFEDDLTRVLDQLDGIAEFTTMEDWLRIRVSIAQSGSGNVAVVARPASDSSTELRFTIATDQSSLSETASQLRAAIRFYPVKGPNRDNHRQ